MLAKKIAGEPYVGKSQVRFDEGEQSLYRKEGLDIRHDENWLFEWLLDAIPMNWRY